MKRDTFYQCKECGNMVIETVDGEGTLECCGKPMEKVVPNQDGAPEKHVPDVQIKDDVLMVNIGAEDHPMIDVHYIPWIYVVTDKGVMVKCLKPGDEPHADFVLGGQEPKEVYEYCTVHGLWKVDL